MGQPRPGGHQQPGRSALHRHERRSGIRRTDRRRADLRAAGQPRRRQRHALARDRLRQRADDPAARPVRPLPAQRPEHRGAARHGLHRARNPGRSVHVARADLRLPSECHPAGSLRQRRVARCHRWRRHASRRGGSGRPDALRSPVLRLRLRAFRISDRAGLRRGHVGHHLQCRTRLGLAGRLERHRPAHRNRRPGCSHGRLRADAGRNLPR